MAGGLSTILLRPELTQIPGAAHSGIWVDGVCISMASHRLVQQDRTYRPPGTRTGRGRRSAARGGATCHSQTISQPAETREARLRWCSGAVVVQ